MSVIANGDKANEEVDEGDLFFFWPKLKVIYDSWPMIFTWFMRGGFLGITPPYSLLSISSYISKQKKLSLTRKNGEVERTNFDHLEGSLPPLQEKALDILHVHCAYSYLECCLQIIKLRYEQ